MNKRPMTKDYIRYSLRSKNAPSPEKRAEAMVGKPYQYGDTWRLLISTGDFNIDFSYKTEVEAEEEGELLKNIIAAAIRADRRGEEPGGEG